MRRLRANRHLWTLLHRYIGLVLAGFLSIVGVTGALLAFHEELDSLVNPKLFHVSAPFPGAVTIDPLTLREQLLSQHPGWSIDSVDLRTRAGASRQLYVNGAADNEIFVDPYSAEILGTRSWGDISQGVKNLLPFLYELHYSLALGGLGSYALGIVALLWTLDCFVGAYLTLPRPQRSSMGSVSRDGGRTWWTRWAPAWQIRWRASSYKLNFDLHRAGGLWFWAMLLVFAWSAVAFNLRDVYDPVTRTLFDYPDDQAAIPTLATANSEPRIAWRPALEIARQHMARLAAEHGFHVREEQQFGYQGSRGVYSYSVNSSLDVGDELGLTQLLLDGDSGTLRRIELPTGAHSGETVTSWLYALHMGKVGGLPFRLFICTAGLAVAMLSVSGVVIWLRKRRAAALSQSRERLSD